MRFNRWLRWTAVAALPMLSFTVHPEDIDIFSVDSGNTVQVPNVLFVIDNSANWSRQSQQWPEAEIQGQSEVSAIRTVINGLTTNYNIGLFEYVTGGSASDEDSGYVRYHIRPMNSTNKANLSNILTTIYGNINDPTEKRPQSNPYGKLMWDVYNYLAGEAHSNGGTGTPASLADPNAYDSLYSRFHSPLNANADTCRRTVIIFIGNNVSNGPTGDSTLTQNALYNLASGGTALAAGSDTTSGTAAISQIPFADYAVTATPATAKIGYSACAASTSACNTASNATTTPGNTVCTDMGYTNCSCDSTDTIACPSTHWEVFGTSTSQTSTITSTTTNAANPPYTTNTNSGGYTCLAEGNGTGQLSSTYTTASNSNCIQDNPNDKLVNDATGTTVGSGAPTAATPTGTYTRTQTSWASCQFVKNGQTGCSGQKYNWVLKGNLTTTVTKYNVTTTATQTDLGATSACYNDAASCTSVNGGFSCPSTTYNAGCACTAAGSTSGCGAGLQSKYQVIGTYTVMAATQTGTYHTAPSGTTTTYMMDEWARYMRQQGVPIPGAGGARSQVTTYTIDVFNQQQNADFSALLFNAARVGGGKYFQAKDKQSLINALKQILNEVQAVNTAFSSASLPVNATNRAQNENQVFIGVFKPDRQKRPLWFGNLKRYQLISSGSAIDLGDSAGAQAINPNTGFITECAVSYWTTDSTFNGIPYWSHNSLVDPIPTSGCTTNTTSDLSDSPDGPYVEKGAVAEVLRKGNDPAATPDSDGNYVVNRTIYTRTSSTGNNTVPPLFTVANSGSASSPSTGLSDTLVRFIRGEDVLDEDTDSATPPLVPRAQTEPRSSIHADVIHSRPQPLNFGGTTGVVVFYGSNDGMYRAVKASTGQELWSFVAPEHYTKFQRLYANQPLVKYFGDSTPGIQAKDYFFDGSTGVYQTFNTDGTSNTAWIFPTMHRGGRKVYGFDVSNPAAPKYLWSKGCDDSTSPATCDAGFSTIGLTWSFPNVAFIKGFSTSVPVLVMGGGYDSCDDDNSVQPCSPTRGRGIYIINAQSGALIRYFDFSGVAGARGIAADVALVDVDNDQMADYAYAADTGGNIYRLDFVDTSKAPLSSSNWLGSRVAYTNGGVGLPSAGTPSAGRKFLFAPAVLQSGASTVYVALGSGDREHPLMAQYPFGTLGNPASAVLNRFYVFKDNLADVDPATATNLDDTTVMADYSTNTTCATAAITPASAQTGWFMNLNANGQGEQTVTSAVIAAGFVFFSTNRPTPDSTTACTTSLGEARGYFMNVFNASGAIGNTAACGGTRSSTFVGGGLPPSPVLATVPINGVLRTVVIGAVQKNGEPSSPIESQRVRPPIQSDRKPIYWYKSTGDK